MSKNQRAALLEISVEYLLLRLYLHTCMVTLSAPPILIVF